MKLPIKKLPKHRAPAPLARSLQFNRPTVIAVGMLASVIGIFVILRIFAATATPLAFEAESGSRTGGASVISDASSSAGQAVAFNPTSSAGATALPSPGSWTNITGNLAGMQASCGNFGGIWPVPGSTALVAGVGQVNLFKSNAGANSWTELGTAVGSVKVANRVGVILYDPANANIFYEAGIYGGGGVFKTTDGGATFKQLGAINHIDAVAVDFSDASRQTLVAGGHESGQTVYRSSDGGSNWTAIGGSLPAGSGFSSNPVVINATTYIVNTYPSWGGGTPGIYRTTNSGASWTKVSSEAANSPALISNGSIYYSDGNGLVSSSDNGLTWAVVGSNLRSEFRPNVLPDGRLISANNNNKLVVSADGGSSWTEFGAAIPYASGNAAGVAYSPVNKAFYIWRWDCGNAVLPDAAMELK